MQVEGLHCWPDAFKVFPEVNFLSNVHRHNFHITCKKRVQHDDRDVEFIMFKRDVLEHLKEKYYDKRIRCHDFKTKSCEMLAKELMDKFNLKYCSVFEDNENGAEIYE